jgi:hypothetical protein
MIVARTNRHNTKIYTKAYGYVDIEYDINWTIDPTDNEWLFAGICINDIDPDVMPLDLVYDIITDKIIESGISPLDYAGDPDEETYYVD